MSYLFKFGEKVKGYEVPVINEREARAGAGILLLPAIFSFAYSYLLHDFTFTKIFVTFFMVDFFIRVLISPHYAPTLIIGRFFVQNQKPEYVGAPQKRFAWSIGFMLSVVMFLLIVVFEIMTPIKIVICLLCIMLLFSEAAFGICIGCYLYHKILSDKPQYCPGEICEVRKKEKIQQLDRYQIFSLVAIILLMFLFSWRVIYGGKETDNIEKMRCGVGKCGSVKYRGTW